MFTIFKEHKDNVAVIFTHSEDADLTDKSEIEHVIIQKFKILI